MFNNYFNTSGKAKILIKAASNGTIAGKNYVEGQVITKILDASFTINYESLGKSAVGKTYFMGYNDFEARTLNIMSQNVNNTLADLLFTKKEVNVNYLVTELESQSTDTNGTFILNNIPHSGTMIYNSARDLVTGFTVDSDGVVTGLSSNTDYYASYKVQKQFDYLYSAGKNSLPYFSIEIQNEANVGNAGKNMVINIPKASLEINPNLNFNAGEITSLELIFHIINAEMFIGFY